MKKHFDASLYLVTDQAACQGRDLLGVIQEAVQGGVSAVQLREKQIATRPFVDLARRIKALLADTPVPLIINDRVDVALTVGAEGVHLGQDDLHPREARRLLGPEPLIGLSVNTPEQVREAGRLEVDYLGAGPVFPTPTKSDHKAPLGLEGLREMTALARVPVVAIGSISVEVCPKVLQTGVDGIAVVSAVCSAPSPEQAARRLRACVSAFHNTDPE
jgi:thiamine-phosphate pyrophosphorylase